MSWQQRLASIIHYHGKAEIAAFLADTARPALESVAEQMRERGLSPAVEQEEDQVAFIVSHADRGAFHYSIRLRSFRAPSFAWAETRRAQEADRLHYRAVAFTSEADESHDVTGFAREQLIDDLLSCYARFRHQRRISPRTPNA